jgi:hypothetical protein
MLRVDDELMPLLDLRDLVIAGSEPQADGE